jgi:Flp pilus assembly CpaF family ATPase
LKGPTQVNNVINEIKRRQDGGVKVLQATVDGEVFVKGFRVNASVDPVTIDLLPE